MVNDTEARSAVRALIERFDFIAKQAGGVAYVLAKRDKDDYARVLESAERAVTCILEPLDSADGRHRDVHAALDDREADWPKAVFAMLNRGSIQFHGAEALRRLRSYQELEEQFEAEEKRARGEKEKGSGD